MTQFNETDRSVGGLEMWEYLTSSTLTEKFFAGHNEEAKLVRCDEFRELLRLHRVQTIAWLMQAGVTIPVKLMTDDVHRKVGEMLPDRRIS